MVALLLPGAAIVGALLLLGPREDPARRTAHAADWRERAPGLLALAPDADAGPAADHDPASEPPEAGATGLGALIRLLDDRSAPRRDRVVREIARRGGDEAWHALVARLRDPALRTPIEIALGRFAPPAVIDACKRGMLDAPDPRARASIARILAATADPAHGRDIRALLDREREPEVRHAAIGALGRFGDRDSAAVLVRWIGAGGRDGGAAAYAFLDITREETLQAVAAMSPAPCAEARLALLHAAAALERPAAAVLDAAREALHDRDERLRAAAIGLLSRAGDEGADALLDHALRRDGDEAERTVRALLDIATERAAAKGLLALERLPQRRQEHYRACFLAVLGR